MSATLPNRCFLSVEAESDPTVAARILHLLTVRGEIPQWFSVRRECPQALRIAIELAGVDETAAHVLAEKIRNIPTVTCVSRSWLKLRDAVHP
jgi:hypothetical protein